MPETAGFSELLQRSPLGIACLRPVTDGDVVVDYRFIATNPRFVRLTGATNQNLLGRTLGELHSWDHVVWGRLSRRLLGNNGDPSEELYFPATECRCRVTHNRDGDNLLLWLLETGSAQVPAMPDADRRVLSRLRDQLCKITEQLKQADAERNHSDLLYQAVLASLNEIYIFDAESLNLCFINAGALCNLGYTLEEARQLTPLDLMPMISLAAFQHLIAPLLCREKVQQVFETVHRRKDGSVYPILVHLQLHEKDGRRHFMAIIEDISERKQVEDALRNSERRFRDIFQRTPKIAVQGYDARRRVVFWNRASEDLYGYSAAEAEGRLLEELIIPPLMRAEVIQAHEQWLVNGIEIPAGELVLSRKDGSPVHVFSSHLLRYDAEGRAEMYCVDIDLTEQDKARDGLVLAASVFEHAHEGIIITDSQATILDVNAAFTRITGYSRQEVLGRKSHLLSSGRQDKSFNAEMWQMLETQGFWTGEIWNRRKNGDCYAELLAISAVHDSEGAVQRYVALFSDISALKRQQDQLERIAHYDALTGLPNRSLLADRLKQAMAQALRRGEQLAAVYLDLDGFKVINDTHGRDTGDRLLTSVAERIKRALRDGDTLARLGGDEFVAVLLNLPDQDACHPLLNRLLSAAAEPVAEAGHQLKVSASLGVSFYPQAEAIDADQLLRQADQAMFQAKQEGKNCYHFFDPEHDRTVRDQHEILAQIRLALASREFVVYYQPKVNLHTGRVIGVEALVRWQHPQRGLLLPGAFLPHIEAHPLMVELGDWIIESTLSQIAVWQQAGLNLSASVNIAAQQLEQADFLNKLQSALANHPDVRPGDLELEVLETSALQDMAHISAIMRDCRELGVKFALDDFGTGYSSLTYLKRLPAETIKIDQSFVRDMLDDPDDLAILQGVLGLAASFRRNVIAEGVETDQHGEMLLKLGCQLGQGYAIARPMPAERLEAWIAEWRPPAAWIEATPIAHAELPVLFAMVDHRAWLISLTRYLEDGSCHPHELGVEECRLGQWLTLAGRARYAGHPQLGRIESIHRAIHERAQRLIAIKQQAATPGFQSAIDAFVAQNDELLESLGRLLD